MTNIIQYDIADIWNQLPNDSTQSVDYQYLLVRCRNRGIVISDDEFKRAIDDLEFMGAIHINRRWSKRGAFFISRARSPTMTRFLCNPREFSPRCPRVDL